MILMISKFHYIIFMLYQIFFCSSKIIFICLKNRVAEGEGEADTELDLLGHSWDLNQQPYGIPVSQAVA